MDSRATRTRLLAAVLLALSPIPCLGAGEPVDLFDGTSLEHWTVITCEAVVQDGAILLQSGNGLVETKKKYTDYAFEFEWKALHPELWDSGVYFRYDRIPAGRPWPQRYQVNLRKDMEGDLVGFKEGVNPVTLKPHEWNRFELTVRGTTVALNVNGQPAWRVDGVEQRESPIALQAEVPGGGQFLFRKIRITDLAAPAGARAGD